MFFDGQGSGLPGEQILDLTRLPDGKIDNIECYLITGESESGETKTFWIGKQDFLIHQIRTDVSAKVMQAALPEMTRWNSELMADIHSFSSTETYTNVVVNKQLSRADFVPPFPLFR